MLVAPPLLSALPKRSERSTEEEEEWGWMMRRRRRKELDGGRGMTCGRRGSSLILWPSGWRRAWAWTCPCRGWFSAPPSAASAGPAPASCAPRGSFSALPQYATDPQPVWPEPLRSCGYSPPGFFPAPPASIFLLPKQATRWYVSARTGHKRHTRTRSLTHSRQVCSASHTFLKIPLMLPREKLKTNTHLVLHDYTHQ